MGMVERGVPPNRPDQNGDIPASAQPNPGLLPLSLCQAGEPVTLKSGCMSGLICVGTLRLAFLLFELLRIQRNQAFPHFLVFLPLKPNENLGGQKCVGNKHFLNVPKFPALARKLVLIHFTINFSTYVF